MRPLIVKETLAVSVNVRETTDDVYPFKAQWF